MTNHSSSPLLPKEKAALRLPAPTRGTGSTATLYRYLSYQEAAGRRPTRGELNQLLGRVNLIEALRISALLNSACSEITRPTLANNPAFQVQLETLFFSREWRERICATRWADSPSNCPIFHRHQQLILVQSALENSPLEGGLPWDEEARHIFGEASLMASDLLADRALTEEEMAPPKGARQKIRFRDLPTEAEQWNIRASTLPTFEINLESSTRNGLARARRFWVDLAHDADLQKRAGKEWLDWSAPFAERYKISIQDFLDITTALLLYTAQANPQDEHSVRYLLFDPYYVLKDTRLERGTIAAALELLSRPAAMLKDELPLKGQQRFGWDLTNLARYPLIGLGDGRVAAFDQTFLLKAATEGLYWRIQEALPDPAAFGNMFGHVYDEYVGRILRRVVPASAPPTLPRYHPNPSFRKLDTSSGKAGGRNEEVCDGLVNCEPLLVVAEVKASLLTTRAKYSGDGQALKQDVDGKFATKTGVRQLASNIRRLAAGDRPSVLGYNPSAMSRIFPILVSYDVALATPLLNDYLNQSLHDQLGRLPSTRLSVGKLIVLSTFDVESLEAVCHDTPLSKVLMRYERECSPDTPFRFFLQGNYWEALNTAEVSTAEAFDDVTKSLRSLLFDTGEVLAADEPPSSEEPEPEA